MHPTEVLSQEHRVIESMLNQLEERMAQTRAGGPFPLRFFDDALDFFRNFADGCHHAKEENLLFPRMQERGVPVGGGPIAVMLAEHGEGRGYLKAIREDLEAAAQAPGEARERLFENAAAYIDLLRRHIYKEDNILFRMARMVLQADDVAELQREFASIEIPERFQAAAAAHS